MTPFSILTEQNFFASMTVTCMQDVPAHNLNSVVEQMLVLHLATQSHHSPLTGKLPLIDTSINLLQESSNCNRPSK